MVKPDMTCFELSGDAAGHRRAGTDCGLCRDAAWRHDGGMID
jgi:hypothetical protein